MSRNSVCRRSFLLATCLLALALPKQAMADEDCRLAKAGDCCTVTLSPKAKTHITTDIISEETVDYVVLRTRDAYTCTLQFDGDIKLPMRVRPYSFTGTWIGGEATLAYTTDTNKLGSCTLDIFRMSIKGAGNDVLAAVCEKNVTTRPARKPAPHVEPPRVPNSQ